MTDTKVEGLLGVAMTLITVGISLVTAGQDIPNKVIGVVIVAMGFVLILYRGQQKDVIAGKVLAGLSGGRMTDIVVGGRVLSVRHLTADSVAQLVKDLESTTDVQATLKKYQVR